MYKRVWRTSINPYQTNEKNCNQIMIEKRDQQ